MDNKHSITDVLGLTSSYCKIAGLKILKEQGYTDITSEQFGLLYILSQKEGLYQSQIANLLVKDRPNITRMVDILEKKGFLRRAKDETNRRIMKLYITDEGRQKVEALEPLRHDFIKTISKDFTEDELEELFYLLKKIRTNIEKAYDVQLWK